MEWVTTSSRRYLQALPLALPDGYAPLLACNGKLFSGLQVFDLDPKNFVLLDKIDVSKETFTPVAISAGRMFVRGRMEAWSKLSQPPEPGCIYAIDLRK